MNTIKLIACDIDGVLLEDTFSIILRKLCSKLEVEYTREIERNMFSRNREEAMNFIVKKLNITDKNEGKKLYNLYFEERDKHLKEQPTVIVDGLKEFLELLSAQNVKVICYGGLSEEQIVEEFKPYMKYFEKYICTNDFRPGIKEIVKDIYKLNYNEVLFIDDVNTVAETAKELRVPFIGVPSIEEWSYQKDDMIKTGVKNIVSGIKEINIDLLNKIDREASNGDLW